MAFSKVDCSMWQLPVVQKGKNPKSGFWACLKLSFVLLCMDNAFIPKYAFLWNQLSGLFPYLLFSFLLNWLSHASKLSLCYYWASFSAYYCKGNYCQNQRGTQELKFLFYCDLPIDGNYFPVYSPAQLCQFFLYSAFQ